jgi:hypothetical protein
MMNCPKKCPKIPKKPFKTIALKIAQYCSEVYKFYKLFYCSMNLNSLEINARKDRCPISILTGGSKLKN